MKKKKVELGKKLLLSKETIAQLNADQQHQLVGGLATALCQDTYQISSCRASSPAPGRPCCQIP